MIEHLKKLENLIEDTKKAGMIEKGKLAGQAATVSFDLLRIMATRLVAAEQRIKQLEASNGQS